MTSDGRLLGKQSATFTALAAVLVFAAAFVAAVYLREDFNLFSDYLSALSSDGLSAQVFNTGLMVCGIFLFLFFLALRNLSVHTGLASAGVTAGAISGVGLVATGLFPSGDPLHQIFAAGFFLPAAVAVLLISLTGYKPGTGTRKSTSAAGAFLATSLLFGITFQPIFEHIAVLFFGAWLISESQAAQTG